MPSGNKRYSSSLFTDNVSNSPKLYSDELSELEARSFFMYYSSLLSGTPAWGLDVVLTTPLRKKKNVKNYPLDEMLPLETKQHVELTYLLTYLLTYCMEQSPSGEANQ